MGNLIQSHRSSVWLMRKQKHKQRTKTAFTSAQSQKPRTYRKPTHRAFWGYVREHPMYGVVSRQNPQYGEWKERTPKPIFVLYFCELYIVLCDVVHFVAFLFRISVSFGTCCLDELDDCKGVQFSPLECY